MSRNFSFMEVVSPLLHVPGIPPTVPALLMVRMAELWSKEDPFLAHALLRDVFRAVQTTLTETSRADPTGEVAVASIFLEQYFIRSGDWRQMDESLSYLSGIYGAHMKSLNEQINKLVQEMRNYSLERKKSPPSS